MPASRRGSGSIVLPSGQTMAMHTRTHDEEDLPHATKKTMADHLRKFESLFTLTPQRMRMIVDACISSPSALALCCPSPPCTHSLTLPDEFASTHTCTRPLSLPNLAPSPDAAASIVPLPFSPHISAPSFHSAAIARRRVNGQFRPTREHRLATRRPVVESPQMTRACPAAFAGSDHALASRSPLDASMGASYAGVAFRTG
ncbi:hypothetical protein C8R43DRAFT_1126670 [Mycena crocata]|nr:hypothetical protein C8R43DRAFT_1126670 [Mycena crocata]